MIIASLRRALVGLSLLASLVVPVAAGEVRAWDAAAFAAAQAASQPVVLHVTAPWCPTCRAQKPVIEQLASSADNPDLLVLEIDFDSQKEVLRQFGVRQQSTLIAYRGAEEVARVVGVTNAGALADFVATVR